MAGFSCSRNTAAPKIIANGCGRSKERSLTPPWRVKNGTSPVTNFQSQVKKLGDWVTSVFPDWDPGGAVAAAEKKFSLNVFTGQLNVNWILFSL